MTDIILTTLNAKYIHAAFGLRYLLANLGDLQHRARILEFDIHQRPVEIAEAILLHNPKIIGLGVYIWNIVPCTALVALLKRLRPDIQIVLGGPEVSYEWDEQTIVRTADHLVTGEADLEFPKLCQSILDGATGLAKIIHAPPPPLASVAFPYAHYTPDDIAHRVLYVEASRGCPFTCEFCLSSLEIPVRQFPLEPFLKQLESLLERGALQFKFVDRTFNLNLQVSRAILQFFMERLRPGLFLHFEMIPDRLPAELRDIIRRFPAGCLQFEVGIQTFDDATSERISRRQDCNRLEDNLRFLRRETGVHVHADLIAGLPGETVQCFAAGFDRLVALEPQEIQLGMLKRLRGTPIIRHDAGFGMLYNPEPPYEILANSVIDFAGIQQLSRMSRYWDLVANSGRFAHSLPLLLQIESSAFASFSKFSEWLYKTSGSRHSIALPRLMEWIFEYLAAAPGIGPASAAAAVWRDYCRDGRADKPEFLKAHLLESASPTPKRNAVKAPRRQQRHLTESSPAQSDAN